MCMQGRRTFLSATSLTGRQAEQCPAHRGSLFVIRLAGFSSYFARYRKYIILVVIQPLV